MPGFSQDAEHRGSSLVGDSHVFTGKIKIWQSALVIAHDMVMRGTQFTGLLHKQILAEMIRDGRVEIVVRRGSIVSFCFSLLCHLLVHGSACGPCLAPVIPTFYAIRHMLKIIKIYTVGDKPGSPVIYRALHLFVSRHVLLFILSRYGSKR